MTTLPTSQYVEITPELAKQLLAKHVHNRPLSRLAVASLALEMTQGRWRATHQGIALNSKGELIDGQHRLNAVIQSGCTVTMMVTTGVDEVMEVDTGRRRTPGDILIMTGRIDKAGTQVTAGARLALMYDSGNPRPWVGLRHAITTSALDEYLAKNPKFQDGIGRMQSAKHIMAKTSALAADYIIKRWARESDYDADQIERFWHGLITGENLPLSDPRLSLRNYLNGRSIAVLNNRVRGEMQMLTTLRVFYAYVLSEPLDRIMVHDPNTYLYRLPEVKP